MRKVGLDSLKPGTRLAKSIFSVEGRVLLAAGVVMRQAYINKLRDNGVFELYIEDEISKDIFSRDIIREQTRMEARAIVKEAMDNYVFSKSINLDRVRSTVNAIISQLLQDRDIVINLTDIKTIDDYTFAHSVNVCVLSLLTAIEVGFKGDRLRELGIGSLLHDIGKLRIPEQLLKKPTQLNADEFEEIKKHTVYGYDILREQKGIGITPAVIALSHHERFDGSGYPLGIKGRDVQQPARIVAVADVYDALTSDRVYRRRLRPHEVLEYMTTIAVDHFDMSAMNGFVKYVALYPAGSGVVLNTRERGIVVENNPSRPTRPLVRIILDRHFRKLKKSRHIDLSEETGLYIIDTCEL